MFDGRVVSIHSPSRPVLPLSHVFRVLGVILLSSFSASSAVGQGLAAGSVSGTVTDQLGRPVPGALVTLGGLDVAGGRERTTDVAGRFTFSLVSSGTYEVRVEAFGYRPVLARPLSVSARSVDLALRLTEEPPPVTAVDTVAASATVVSDTQGGSLRLGRQDLRDLPLQYADLASIARLDSSFDESLGSSGLPGSMSLVVADGLPIHRAPHPLARSEDRSIGSIPSSFLGDLTVHDAAPSAEWGGSGAGYIPATTRSGTGRGVDVEAGWSGGPLWTSSRLDVREPSLTSFRGSMAATLPVTAGTSQLALLADALRLESPVQARIDATSAASLSGADPDVVAALSEPSTERFSRFAGAMRFDALQGESSRWLVSGAFGLAKREFEGPGRATIADLAAPPEESVEYSVTGAYVSELRPGAFMELRAGLSRSDRSFGRGDGFPAAWLAGSGLPLGVAAGAEGESSRTDVMFLPVVRMGFGPGALELGGATRFTWHGATRTVEERLYSDGAALVAGSGVLRATSSPSVDFSARELGAFLEYDVQARPGVTFRFGGRIDYEMVPDGDVRLNTAWLDATGLRNDVYPTRFRQLGASASVSWDPGLDGRTLLGSSVSLDHGDLEAPVLAQLLAQDDEASVIRYAGTGLTWPEATLPGSATSLPGLTLLGPDARAPRSLNVDASVSRQLSGGWSVHVRGAYRRTDFLMRRRNLNVPVAPAAVDAYGRDVFGTLQQDGTLVFAHGADARRFATFGDAWALDPDGWSEYRAVTAGIDYASTLLDLRASYTTSETTDNWIGASRAWPEAELSPGLPEGPTWAEGTSDFDVTHRVAASATARISVATVSASYGFRSGLPFTPGYRHGVDANGDGAIANDVAFVDASAADALPDLRCVVDQVGGFAARNSCRGPSAHRLDARLSVRVARVGGRDASIVLEGFDLIETSDGLLDTALLLVDPSASITTSPDGSTVTVPVVPNPQFGRVIHPASRGRMISIGFRIG